MRSAAPMGGTPSAAHLDESGAAAVADVQAPGILDATAVRRVWDDVLAVVRKRSPKAWAVVREASVRDVHGELIVLLFQHTVHANMFGAQADLLVEALREVLGGSWSVRADLAGDSGTSATSASARQSEAAPPRQPARPTQPTRRDQPVQREPGRPAQPAQRVQPAADDGDWPSPARLGGAAEPPVTGAEVPPRSPRATPAKSAPARAAVRAPTGKDGTGRNDASNNSTDKNGTDKTGTDKTGTNKNGTGRDRANAPSRTSGKGSVWADGPAPDEPPYDPDYDGMPPPEGFDPGDELLDDAVAPLTARQASEEQAFRLLAEQLGAERISDPPRP